MSASGELEAGELPGQIVERARDGASDAVDTTVRAGRRAGRAARSGTVFVLVVRLCRRVGLGLSFSSLIGGGSVAYAVYLSCC